MDTPSPPSLAGPAEVRDQLIALGRDLRRDLGAVVADVAGEYPRPARLTSRLDLDKSLASRLLRALRASDDLELLHFLPSPGGLWLLLSAAERHGVDPGTCRIAHITVERFQATLDAFPGGRATLDSLISESVAEVRERADRTAQQSVHRGMSHLLGVYCDTITSAVILQPSEDGLGVDGVDVSRRVGLRRVRPSAPVTVFSISLDPVAAKVAGQRLVPLGSSVPARDAREFFLPGFCDPAEPPVETHVAGHHTVFALAEERSFLPRPVTITLGMMIRNGWRRFSTSREQEAVRGYLLHSPCKLLVRDLYIRDDLYVGAFPETRLEFPSPVGGPSRPEHRLPHQLDTLDLAMPVQQLGIGLEHATVGSVPGHDELLAHAFASAGWDPRRFRGYRVRVVHPVPMIMMTWNIRLPETH